jgi:hypothetical protein
VDFDQDLVGGGGGIGKLFEPEDVGIAELVDADGFHGRVS